MDAPLNAGPGGYGPPPGGGYGPPPGGGGYGAPPGGYGGPPPGGFGGGGGNPYGPPGPQMPGPNFGPPMGPGFGPQNTSNGLAIGSLVCGILALPTTCCCSLASLPLAIAACVMGGLALSKVKSMPAVYGGKGMAMGGLICGIVAVLVSIAFLALGMGQALVDQYQRTH